MPAAKRAKGVGGVAIPQTGKGRASGNGMGEVRFESPAAAQQALHMLNGSLLQGSPLAVTLDNTSKDGTKLLVSNLPAGLAWQEIKDHFAVVGPIAFADIKGQQTGPPASGEVRFETAAAATNALAMLNGTTMETGGGPLAVSLAPNSKDGTKLLVSGMPPGTEWQELKDHFKKVGEPIAHAAITLGPASLTAEVRYDSADHTKLAASMLHGSDFGGREISVTMDPKSKDGTKLLVSGLAPGTQWQELKDHFGTVGPVGFCQVSSGLAGQGKGNFIMMPMPIGMDGMMMPHMMQQMFAMMNGGKGAGMVQKGAGKNGGADAKHFDAKVKVWIGGLPPSATWKELQGCLSAAGLQPKWVEVTGDGIGIAAFATPAAAAAAIAQLNGSMLGGVMIQADKWGM